MKTLIFFVTSLFSTSIVSAQTLTTLVKFNDANGALPQCTLTQARNGNFYGTTTGTTVQGDYGTIFKMTPYGVLTTLVKFNGTNGYAPPAGLLQASDGNFYFDGFVSGYGVFKMTPEGVLTTLVNLNYTNIGGSLANLVQGTDGNLYGIGFGGLYNQGAIFRTTTNGALTILANFNGTNGAYNDGYGGLVQGMDGNFYGAAGGGLYNTGIVYQVTMDGALTTLFNFNGTNGSFPYGGLMQASDGNFYGTTWKGGGNGYGTYGTVFRMTPDGRLTTLVTFYGFNGASPEAPLMQASDGNLYGTTSGDPGGSYGSVFKMTLNGIFTTLVTFNETNGAFPGGGLVEGTDGNLYGTTSAGGDLSNDYGGDGTIFKITGLNLLPAFQSITLTNGTVNLTWNSVSNWTYRVQYKTNLTDANWTDLPGDVLATNAISSKTDVAVPAQRFYRLILLR